MTVMTPLGNLIKFDKLTHFDLFLDLTRSLEVITVLYTLYSI